MVFVTPDVVALIVVSIILLMALVMFSIAYVARSYIELIESRLPNSKAVEENKAIHNKNELVGKIMRLHGVVMMLLLPRIYARRGLVEIDDVKEFPRGMKCLLLFLHGSFFALLGALVGIRSWLQ
ncbi:hypothetical protein ACIPZG_17745 [Pseudomonas sp. NPDC089395]|uniref:hypothetical protein n=1 Tax=Pseudomonas sp. NPDC089395 TaxID=3364460 RepID=UPI00382B63FB